MNYQEAIEFLYSSLPMYQRVGKAAYKANLDNTIRMDEYFGHPHRRFPAVHVAGTNGKGSVSHMLASVFQQSGYKTGLYTSPHLLDFRERIRVNGQAIPEKEVTGFINSHLPMIREVSPSFFEMTVAMAFDHFAREGVDMAIIETGMGGRLDSTNIITPLLSVITNISMDHMEFLGSDLSSIAREKGGIIKPGIPLVAGQTGPEPETVLLSMARELKAPAFLVRQAREPLFQTMTREGASLIRFQNHQNGSTETWGCGLTGSYQKENVATVLSAVDCLREMGWNLSEASVQEGLSKVTANTGIMGRWQTVGSNPKSICDTAHNQAGIAAAMDQVMQTPWKELHMVFGVVGDKDLGGILPLLPREAHYYFTRSKVPRSMDALILRKKAAACGLSGKDFPSVKEAYKEAQGNAAENDMIFTGGSTFVVADLLELLGY
ncbi:MAG: folylpolyglutamate synthase/dihydrofolate synthase family protein [Bacteroidota bacterium]